MCFVRVSLLLKIPPKNILFSLSASSSSPLDDESVGDLLHSMVLRAQQLPGPLIPYTVKPGVVELRDAGVLLWDRGRLCIVELLHLLQELLTGLIRQGLQLATSVQRALAWWWWGPGWKKQNMCYFVVDDNRGRC